MNKIIFYKNNYPYTLPSSLLNSFYFKNLLFLFSLCLLTACQSRYEIKSPHEIKSQHASLIESATNSTTPKTSQSTSRAFYDITVRSFDGTQLAATVYQPELSQEQTAPLVIHSHSFSTFRMSQPLSLYGTLMFAGKTALELWDQGYWVISFDQRGHGKSGGKIALMSPEHEVRDVQSLIDWAVAHLPKLKMESNDPVIGMLGESYTGSLQLMASTQDPRIDAIVPIHTWYDLSHSLSPDNVPKGWLSTLIVAGNGLNPFRVEPLINNGYREAVSKGKMSDKFLDALRSRSIKPYCNSGQLPHADAFVMQGFKDTLFNFNQGLWIRDCFERAGRDVRFLGTQKGHVLPLAHQDGLMPFHDVDSEVNCGQATYNTQKMIVDWFDEKLKHIKNQADYIPNVCLTVKGGSGQTMDRIPIGGETFTFDSVKLHSGMAGLMEWPFIPFDWLANTLTFKQSAAKNSDIIKEQQGGRFRPAFAPLTKTSDDNLLLGIPRINVTVSNKNDRNKNADPVRLYVGIGVIEPGKANFRLIGKQVTPINGTGDHHIMLSGISQFIPAHSTLGLVVYGYSNQYRFAFSGLQTNAKLTGEVELPLSDPDHPHQTILTSTPDARQDALAL